MVFPRNSKVFFTYSGLISLNLVILYYSTGIFQGQDSSVVKTDANVVEDDSRMIIDDAIKESTSLSASSKKLRILVLTSFRSGSSYVGHLFASNPEVFYMYEPLGAYNPETDHKIQTEIVNASSKLGYKCIDKPAGCRMDYIFNCQLLQFFSEALYRTPQQEGVIREWYSRIFAEMEMRLNIKSTRVALDNICNDRYNIVVAKTIRAYYLREVVPLMKNGLKVIYLVRDPRGVLNSRHRMFKMDDAHFQKNVVVECEKYGANIDFLTTEVRSDPELLRLFKQNFMFVRYEDVTLDLYGHAQKIYNFVGLEMPHEVEVFAKSNAKVNLWARPNVAVERPEFEEKKELIPWRQELSFTHLKTVENVCQKELDRFGYKPLYAEYNLKNISYPVIGNIHKDLLYFTCDSN